jgi:hypothetical protein
MQSGVATITRWWLLAACGRNPLVRAVDRLQLLVIALAILAGLFAAAAAGALGTAVHEARTSTYAAQSQMRQSATATAATATAAGASTETGMSVWQLRIGAPQGHPASRRVDPQMVSDIRSACRVDAAHSTRQATVDAIAIACVAWQAVAIAVAGLVCWTRSRLDRSRDAAWENDIRELLNDGGRTRD